MTEKEKMISGLEYNSMDEELLNERYIAREFMYQYNNSKPQEDELRKNLIRNYLGKTGENFYLELPLKCDYGYNIEIGENFYSNFDLIILDNAPVRIGDNVMIGPGVRIFTATHPLEAEKRNLGLESAKPVTIGNNVWIGGGAIINPGVTIGDNTVIGSGSVVTKDIPAGVLAAGNPCRVIKTICTE